MKKSEAAAAVSRLLRKSTLLLAGYAAVLLCPSCLSLGACRVEFAVNLDRLTDDFTYLLRILEAERVRISKCGMGIPETFLEFPRP